MTRPNTDHVTMQDVTADVALLQCGHCGEQHCPVLPMAAASLADRLLGFVRMHRLCPKPADNTPSKQVALFDALVEQEAARAEHPATNPFAECERLAQAEERSRAYVATVTSFGTGIVESRHYGIDGMSDEPDPETDPPGPAEHDLPELTAHEDPEALARLFRVPRDLFALRADLGIVLQRIEGALLPSKAAFEGIAWHSSTIRFQTAAAWVRDELARMNLTEYPHLAAHLPAESQPMPADLHALVFPTKKKRGARPLSSPKKRRGKEAATP